LFYYNLDDVFHLRDIQFAEFQPARCAGLMAAVASGLLIQVHDDGVSFLLNDASDSGKSENLKTWEDRAEDVATMLN